MIRLFTSIVFIILFTAPGFSQTFTTVGTAAGTNTATAYPTPFGDYYKTQRQQFLFRANELLAAGIPSGAFITHLQWNVISLNGAGITENYTLKIILTPTTTLTTNGWEPGGFTVFTTASYQPVTGINQFDITDFIWNGTDNIVVEVCGGDPVGSWTNNAGVQYSLPGFNASRTFRSDTQTGVCAYTGTSTTGQQATRRPVTTFGWVPPTPCAGIPTAGTANASVTNICPNVNFTLSLNGNTVAGGITYEWLSSPDGINFTSTGGVNSSYTTSITDTTYFICVVTCTNSAEDDTSNIVVVYADPFFNCYCTSNATSTFDEDIFRVAINTMDNNSGCTNATYTNYTSVSPADIMKGMSETVELNIGTCGGQYNTISKVFIDYNQDGDYLDPGETVFTSGVTLATTGTGTLISGIFNVPLTATTGMTGMRVVLVETTNPAIVNPCGTYTWGETEDYIINILPAPPINPGVVSISGIASSCGLGLETVEATIVNAGSDTLYPGDSLDIFYNDGTNSFNETIILSDTIDPVETFLYTFTNQADLTVNGTYPVVVYIVMAGDTIQFNDTATLSVTSIPTISSYPYLQDFEIDNGDWITYGTLNNWEWGAPAQTVINSSVPCGDNAWTTGLTTNYNANATNYLQTPCFDLTGFANEPVIRFNNIYYTQVTLEDYWIESSIDNGATWVKVLPSSGSFNWYNNISANVWEGNSTIWREAMNRTTALAGQSQVMFRYVLTSNATTQYEGVGVDNFYLGDGYANMYTESVTAPVSGCGLTSTEPVVANFYNSGFDTIVDPSFCYSVNGGPSVCEIYTGAVPPGQLISYTFTGTADLSVIGTHTVAVYTTATGDIINCDTFYRVVNNKPIIISYPYFENFENGVGGWESGGTNSTWAFGTPAKTTIQGAASGVNAWTTGGLGTSRYNNSEQSYVVSPCFDFTNLPAEPWVAVKIWRNAEFSWDGGAIQMSKDQGVTWTTVGTFNAATLNFPFNWYNDNTINGSPGGQQNGWTTSSTGWFQASHPIDTTGFSGETNVWFRVAFGSDGSVNNYDGIAFDDFAVGTLPQMYLNDTVTCANYNLSSGYPAGIFNWSGQDTSTMVTTTIATTPDIFMQNPNMADSVINVMLVFTDTMGFSNFDTALVTLLPTPYTELGNDFSICYDDTVVLAADSASGYTYNWSNGGVTPTIAVNSGGTYAVNVIDNISGCSHQDTVTIYQVAPVDLNPTLGICDGQTGTLDAGPDYSVYSWSTLDSTQSIIVSATGQYSITVTDSIGCVSVDSIMVTLNPNPVVDLGADTVICTFNTIVLDAGSGFSAYLWNDLSNGQTMTVSGSMGIGTYFYVVKVTDANGCEDRDTVSVMVDPCLGISEYLAGDIMIYPNPSNGIFNIQSDIIEGKTTVEVFSLDGKLVYSNYFYVTKNNVFSINLSTFERGFYQLRLINNEKQMVIPVILDR